MKKEFKVIAGLLPNNTRVLDVGGGDGSLMNLLEKEKILSYLEFSCLLLIQSHQLQSHQYNHIRNFLSFSFF